MTKLTRNDDGSISSGSTVFFDGRSSVVDTAFHVSKIVKDFTADGRDVSVRKVQNEVFRRTGIKSSNKTVGDELRRCRGDLAPKLPPGAPVDVVAKILEYSVALARASVYGEMNSMALDLSDAKIKNQVLIGRMEKVSIVSPCVSMIDVGCSGNLRSELSASELESSRLLREVSEWRVKAGTLEIELIKTKSELSVAKMDAEAKSSTEWKQRFDELARINYEARLSDKVRIESLELHLSAAKAAGVDSANKLRSRVEDSDVRMNAFRRKSESLTAEISILKLQNEKTITDTTDGRDE